MTLHCVQASVFAIEGKLIEYGGNRIKGRRVLNYILIKSWKVWATVSSPKLELKYASLVYEEIR